MQQHQRRKFLRWTGLAGIGLSLDIFSKAFSLPGRISAAPAAATGKTDQLKTMDTTTPVDDSSVSLIGLYGEWAAGLQQRGLPAFSYRRPEWKDLQSWKAAAKKQLLDRLAMPALGAMPKVNVIASYEYDGLQIEELSWQLPYGRPTTGLLLKPQGNKHKLPAILALHDHGGNKYFGTKKITRVADVLHPSLAAHQQEYYEGRAWANEIARKGYVVLVPDAFPFASRRVWLQDVPEHLRQGLSDNDPENPANIIAYNTWASEHEHIMAKSLFSAGTTWPGVFLAEDRMALDILCARDDVDSNRVGCGGLSGGGMRTIFLGGTDDRIKCAVCVGFMTTWRDLVLNKSYTHTWMTYVPLLPAELDLPELLGLRVPLPVMVQNNAGDQLFTPAAMQEADLVLKEIYSKAQHPGNYRCNFYPGAHKFDQKMQADAFDWFDRWLKA
jgi:dienelactone hydrolase